MWIVNPFIARHIKWADLEEMSVLVELHCDFAQKSSIDMYSNYGDYWVGLLVFPEYKSIALKGLQSLVMMTTLLSEQGFSTLEELKTKKTEF